MVQDSGGESAETLQHQREIPGVARSFSVRQEPKSQRPQKVSPNQKSDSDAADVSTDIPLLSLRDTERNKEIAFLEAQVYELVEILGVSVGLVGRFLVQA